MVTSVRRSREETARYRSPRALPGAKGATGRRHRNPRHDGIRNSLSVDIARAGCRLRPDCISRIASREFRPPSIAAIADFPKNLLCERSQPTATAAII
jgi:hypothetical protein